MIPTRIRTQPPVVPAPHRPRPQPIQKYRNTLPQSRLQSRHRPMHLRHRLPSLLPQRPARRKTHHPSPHPELPAPITLQHHPIRLHLLSRLPNPHQPQPRPPPHQSQGPTLTPSGSSTYSSHASATNRRRSANTAPASGPLPKKPAPSPRLIPIANRYARPGSNRSHSDSVNSRPSFTPSPSPIQPAPATASSPPHFLPPTPLTAPSSSLLSRPHDRRSSQVVRQKSAKLPFAGSIPASASILIIRELPIQERSLATGVATSRSSPQCQRSAPRSPATSKVARASCL